MALVAAAAAALSRRALRQQAAAAGLARAVAQACASAEGGALASLPPFSASSSGTLAWPPSWLPTGQLHQRPLHHPLAPQPQQQQQQRGYAVARSAPGRHRGRGRQQPQPELPNLPARNRQIKAEQLRVVFPEEESKPTTVLALADALQCVCTAGRGALAVLYAGCVEAVCCFMWCLLVVCDAACQQAVCRGPGVLLLLCVAACAARCCVSAGWRAGPGGRPKRAGSRQCVCPSAAWWCVSAERCRLNGADAIGVAPCWVAPLVCATLSERPLPLPNCLPAWRQGGGAARAGPGDGERTGRPPRGSPGILGQGGVPGAEEGEGGEEAAARGGAAHAGAHGAWRRGVCWWMGGCVGGGSPAAANPPSPHQPLLQLAVYACAVLWGRGGALGAQSCCAYRAWRPACAPQHRLPPLHSSRPPLQASPLAAPYSPLPLTLSSSPPPPHTPHTRGVCGCCLPAAQGGAHRVPHRGARPGLEAGPGAGVPGGRLPPAPGGYLHGGAGDRAGRRDGAVPGREAGR